MYLLLISPFYNLSSVYLSPSGEVQAPTEQEGMLEI